MSKTYSSIPRAPLSLQTVYFHESDRAQAQQLGNALYEHLTRPIDDRLAFGTGIPVLCGVKAELVDSASSDVVVVVPVLGNETYFHQSEAVLNQLKTWITELGAGRVLFAPLATNWHTSLRQLRNKPILLDVVKPESRQKTLDQIVLAVCRSLDTSAYPIPLLVSHADADLEPTEEVANQIIGFATTDGTAKSFFDTREVDASDSPQAQNAESHCRGVCVAIRSQAFVSRTWCQRKLLNAKQIGLPTLIVELPTKSTRRNSPYSSNSPSMFWDENAGVVVSRAMVEWLADIYFRLEVKRIAKVASLPDDVTIVCRPPELLDLAQGPLTATKAPLIMHPDPELSVVDRQILKAARPRLQFVTPTTAFRRLLNRANDLAHVDAPLQGSRVALSLSNSPDAGGPEGYTAEHVFDATVYLTRSVVSAGAAIIYSGDFRPGGFTYVLAELIKTYNQTAVTSAELLHMYFPANMSFDGAPDIEVTPHHLANLADSILPRPSAEDAPSAALYVSEMRREMEKHASARIILGGGTEPRTEKGPGFGGRYPGVVEEAWRTLKAKAPLYVVGGFGGASAIVADLLEGRETPRRMRDESWMYSPMFSKNAQSIDASPYREKLELPRSMEDLAEAVRALGAPLLDNDTNSIQWNGLNVEENRLLFRTRDPVVIASWVLKGLLTVAKKSAEGKLEIELVRGDVTTANNLDAIAIATFDNLPLGGAGATLDQATSGRASMERTEGHSLISLRAADIDADWLYLASLGEVGKVEELPQRIQKAAMETAHQALRHGFRRLGLVAFGGTMVGDIEDVAKAMLLGLQDLAGKATLMWFEADEKRLERLQKYLAGQKEKVKLSTRQALKVQAAQVERPKELIIRVTYANDELDVTVLPPSGTTIAASWNPPLNRAELDSIVEGRGYNKKQTPDMKALAQRGARVAELLMGPDAATILDKCADSKLVVIHDLEASRLPFESLTTLSKQPATSSGLTRRLLVKGVPIERHFAKPPKSGQLRVLLIANPTEDLPDTEKEAKAVEDLLDLRKQFEIRRLTPKEATKQRVLEELPHADVLHYCGHAFFDGPGPTQSGLILANNERLTLADLESLNVLPRVAFVNGCESLRVRGVVATPAAAFAELFLRSGVEAYVGTYWEVADVAAGTFARQVYTLLAGGETLESAVTKSRAALFEAKEPDWANYILYGEGRFKLVTD